MKANGHCGKILLIMHQEGSSPGRLGMMLRQRGFELDARRPPLGDPLPETMQDHAGVIIFGGPMSANDNDDHIKNETNWISVPLKEEKPLLGICLGAQMMVRHLGGAVAANEREFAEIGYYPLQATKAGRALMEWPDHVYQWHREGFTLPGDAVLLASSEEYPNQAFAYGKNAFGIQFHAELTYHMLCRWTVKGAHRFVLNGAQQRAQQLEGRLIHDEATRAWLDDFIDLWIGPGPRVGPGTEHAAGKADQ